MKSLFEQMDGTYRQEGDYLIPNLTLPDTGNYQIGKYGRMRRTYLKEHRKVLYTNLVTEGNLFKHLVEIDQSCNKSFFAGKAVEKSADWCYNVSDLYV